MYIYFIYSVYRHKIFCIWAHYVFYITCTSYCSNNGIDYTQNKQRKSYAEKCFSKDPPTLELLVINGPEESIKHEAVASTLSNDNICMK